MLKLKPKSREPKRPRIPSRRKDDHAPPTSLQRFLGWCVHAYTGLGLVFAAFIVVLLFRGGHDAFRLSLLLMFVATIVDATDGTLARLVHIKKAVPSFDGRRLDDLIDFQTYTCLPLLLIWRAGLLPPGQEPWLLLPLAASAYGFCQVQAKTDDGYFLGFPSLWNLVAMYLYVLPLDPWIALLTIIILALLTFVPSRYLYPSSQPGLLNIVATVTGVVWGVLVVWLIWNLPVASNPRLDSTTTTLAFLSLFYPIFYMGASWYITLTHWLQKKAAG
jgi:phosphatidylcholine synthase